MMIIGLWEKWYYWDMKCFSYIFIFEERGFQTRVTIDDPLVISREKWIELINFIKDNNNNEWCYNFNNKNDGLFIEYKQETLNFNITTVDHGGNIKINIQLKDNGNKDGILRALEELINNEKAIKYWNNK